MTFFLFISCTFEKYYDKRQFDPRKMHHPYNYVAKVCTFFHVKTYTYHLDVLSQIERYEGVPYKSKDHSPKNLTPWLCRVLHLQSKDKVS